MSPEGRNVVRAALFQICAETAREGLDLEPSQESIRVNGKVITLTIEPASQPQEAVRQDDGPTTEGYFVWQDSRHQFPSKQWRLLQVLWGKPSLSIESIAQHVYDGEDEVETRLRKLVYDTNSRLLKLSLPFEVTSPMSGFYALEKLPPRTSG